MERIEAKTAQRAAGVGAAEQTAMLRLTHVAGLGAVGLGRLSKQFASPSALLFGSREQLAACGVPGRLQSAIAAVRHLDVSAIEAELADTGTWMLDVFQPSYPPLLREIHDPPPVLYGTGRPEALLGPCVAVVGARRASRYGLEHGYRIARGLAEAGVTVVSGLAIGLDAMAHKAALDAGGATAAVLGSGVANIYPAVNAELAVRVARQGAVVSELRPTSGADRVNFPRRNRIISGLCSGVVILEAREDSGSLITAREGADQGREIFVVPGPAGGTNRGGHRLLSEGAHWVEDAEDILKVLRPRGEAARHDERAAAPEPEIPAEWGPVWSALAGDSTHVDSVIERSGLQSAQVLGILLQMELRGLVRQQSGKRFVRAAS